MTQLPTPIPAESRAITETRTVVVIEDDDATRHSTTALLEMLGYGVRSFASCEAFLAEADSIGNACLLLDYHFDGLSGFALLDKLQEWGIFMPTVIYTGRFNAVLRRRAADRPEIVAIVEKPVGGRAIAEAIAKAFATPQPVA